MESFNREVSTATRENHGMFGKVHQYLKPFLLGHAVINVGDIPDLEGNSNGNGAAAEDLLEVDELEVRRDRSHPMRRFVSESRGICERFLLNEGGRDGEQQEEEDQGSRSEGGSVHERHRGRRRVGTCL